MSPVTLRVLLEGVVWTLWLALVLRSGLGCRGGLSLGEWMPATLRLQQVVLALSILLLGSIMVLLSHWQWRRARASWDHVGHCTRRTMGLSVVLHLAAALTLIAIGLPLVVTSDCGGTL